MSTARLVRRRKHIEIRSTGLLLFMGYPGTGAVQTTAGCWMFRVARSGYGFFPGTHTDDFLLIRDVEQVVRSVHETKTAIYTQLVTDGAAALRPGIRELIDQTSRLGIRRAIATTTSLPNVEALLTAAFGHDGMRLFETVCAGDSVAEKKPAPDVYLAVLEEMDLPPKECIALEDSRNGLVAATAAGIPTVVTPGIYTSDQRFDEATVVTADLTASIKDILDEPSNTVPLGSGLLPQIRLFT